MNPAADQYTLAAPGAHVYAGGLPFTGFDLALVVIVAVLLLIAGGCFRMAAR